MRNSKPKFVVILILIVSFIATMQVHAKDTVEEYIREYPNQEQVRMMNAWLQKHEKSTFSFTGLVDPTDATVVTPQATVDYGYNWFSVSDGPAIVKTPSYDKFFSVSIFDMKHNIPAVIVNPDKPILIKRPDQTVPKGDFYVVELETDQGLVFTRMVVVNNMDRVRELSKSIVMEGGKGDMGRDVQRFSPNTERIALKVIDAVIAAGVNPDDAFGKKSGDVGMIMSAAGVKLGQLGTPPDTVRYEIIMTDENGKQFNGDDTYSLTVPANIAKEGGYFSVTIYGLDNQLLIPNDKKIYDRTTYSSKRNSDGTYTITLSPDGNGINGIPTGKPFYGILRAYVPVQGADMTVTVKTK
ncbi:MAG: DUF1214 domain-containing protein [Planctomycetota bacterium]